MTARVQTMPAAGLRPLVGGPWKGVQYTADASDPAYLWYASEAWVNEMGAVEPRPDYTRLAQPSAFVLPGDAQCVAAFRTGALGDYNLFVGGGRVFRWNVVADTFTEMITQANLTAAGVTFSTSLHVYAVQFANLMVFSDGVNTAWAWNGTANGGITKLTNAPVFYGQPTVYYGKLFGIKSTDRVTMVWSEENQVNTGYEAGGFNNAWSLTQTSGEPLRALLGVNDGLYYWRASGIGVVRGAVTPTFAASGVHDSISDEIGHIQWDDDFYGTLAPQGPIYTEGWIFFCDQQGRPWAVGAGGGGLDPLWEQVGLAYGGFGQDAPGSTADPLFFTDAPRGGFGRPAVQAVLLPDLGLVGFVQRSGAQVLWFSVMSRRCVGHWKLLGVAGPGNFAVIGTLPRGSGSEGIGFASASGKCYYAARFFSQLDDYTGTSYTPILSIVVGPRQGSDAFEWTFPELEVKTRRVKGGAGIDGSVYFYDGAVVGTDPEAAPTAFGTIAHDAPAAWSSGAINADASGWERLGLTASGRGGRVYVRFRRLDGTTSIPPFYGAKFRLEAWRLWGAPTLGPAHR